MNNNIHILIGSDHGGFEMKELIKDFLMANNTLTIIDIGTYTKDSCDYPDIAQKLCTKLLENKSDNLSMYFGILICGTGIGISISANKIPGIRCSLCYNEYTSKMARQHNNANVLALGARTTNVEMAIKIIFIFLTTNFEGGRHERRVNKIEKKI